MFKIFHNYFIIRRNVLLKIKYQYNRRVKRYLPLGCIVNELKTGQRVKKFGIYPWIHQYLALTSDVLITLYVNFSICKMGVGRKEDTYYSVKY